MTRRPHVLVIEDELAVRDVVRRYLELEDYAVTLAADGTTGLAAALEARPDLIVLDVMLPGIDGLEICRRLRDEPDWDVPIIMLTALGEADDRIAGLTRGADDYVVKPFSVKELTLRIGALLRRTAAPTAVSVSAVLADGDLLLDPVARTARRDGELISLTTREFDLLAHFLTHPGQVFDRDELLREVWGWEFGDHSTVTVHVKRLRRKVEEVAADPTRLMTVYGRGYRWDGPDQLATKEIR